MESNNFRSWLHGLVAMVAIATTMLIFTGQLSSFYGENILALWRTKANVKSNGYSECYEITPILPL
jgi:hypothetical protein